MEDGQIIFATDLGELLYCNNHLEIKSKLPTSPTRNFLVNCMIRYKDGFIIGGSNQQVYYYEKNDKDIKFAFVKSNK